MTDEQVERLISEVRSLAGAFTSIAKTAELFYQKQYPPKREPRDVDITYVKSEEELLREAQGSTGESTTEDWLNLGPRERAFAEKEREREASFTRESEHRKTRN